MDYIDELNLKGKQKLTINNINCYFKNITNIKKDIFSSKIKFYNFIKKNFPKKMESYWNDNEKIKRFNSFKMWGKIGKILKITV